MLQFYGKSVHTLTRYRQPEIGYSSAEVRIPWANCSPDLNLTEIFWKIKLHPVYAAETQDKNKECYTAIRIQCKTSQEVYLYLVQETQPTTTAARDPNVIQSSHILGGQNILPRVDLLFFAMRWLSME